MHVITCKGKIVIAVKEAIIGKCIVEDNLLAHVIISKYNLHLPIDRLRRLIIWDLTDSNGLQPKKNSYDGKRTCSSCLGNHFTGL